MFWTMFSEEKNLSPINVSIGEKSSIKALIEPKMADYWNFLAQFLTAEIQLIIPFN